MATLQIYTGEDTLLPSTSGLGFFGDDGFGSPIALGEYNGRTFVTNASGSSENFECNNNKYDGPSGVVYGQTGLGISLSNLPNELATINIRFTHGSPAYCQKAKLWIFDGTFNGSSPNKENPVDGLTFYAAEIRHRSNIQTISSAYSDTAWSDLSVSGSNYISLVNSPGEFGIRQGGFEELSDRHDWYVAMTCTPTSLGNKMFGMTMVLEYL